jgi:hypothetical protein
MERSVLFFSRFPAGAPAGGGSRRDAQLAALLRPLEPRRQSCWDLEHMKGRGRRWARPLARLRRLVAPGRSFWVDDDTWEYVLDMRTAARAWRRSLARDRSVGLVLLDDPLFFPSLAEWVHSRGIPLVGLCQNLESLNSGQLQRRRQRELLRREIRVLRQCALVVTISREETFLLRNLGVPAAYLPYDPVPAIRERLRRVRQRRARGGKRDFLALGNAGNRSTRDGMKALVEHWGRRPRAARGETLLVAGYWTPRYLRLPPTAGVEFLGELSDAGLDDLLASVRAVICHQPTGSGALTRIREMLLAGVPVLADAHAGRSYHELQGAGLLEFTGLEGLEAAMAALATAPAAGALGDALPAAIAAGDEVIAEAGRGLLASLKELLAAAPRRTM